MTTTAAIQLTPTIGEIMRRQREYLEAIEPFIKMKSNVIGVQPVRYLQDGDAWVQEIMWTLGSKELCNQIDQMIEHIAHTIYGQLLR
jgi:hypothetical protein